MTTCANIKRSADKLAGLSPGTLPPGVRDHLAACPGCACALAAARLARGLLAVAADGPEPAEGFVARVRAALPAPGAARHAAEDPWRPAWGLVPAFAVTAAALLLLFQASVAPPGPAGLVPAESLSAGERLVLDARQPDADLLLAAVMEGDAR